MSSVDDLMALVRELSSARWSAGVSAGNFDKIGERVASKEADELEAEISALASSMAQWQDIATAPKDGVFLVFMPQERPDDQIQVAKWHPNVKVIGGCFAFDRKPVTHFHALPPPPLSASPEDKP